MPKNKQIVLFLCCYQSVYGGNFIPSLMALEEAVWHRGGSCVYAFPIDATQRVWVRKLQEMDKKIVFVDFKVSRFKLIKTLSQIVKLHNITLIHSHFAPFLPLEILAFLNRKVRVIIHLHSDFSLGKHKLKTTIRNFLLYKLCAGSVRFISVSKAFVDYNPSKITWIPNALSTKRIPCRTTISPEVLRQKYALGETDKVCETFAWSPQVKGLDVAVESIATLNKSENNQYKLLIVCGEKMSVETMPDWVATHTSCNGKESFLIYLPPTEDVFVYHQVADLLLSASRSEGFPYSILEMLSMGKPCVMSDIPGIAWAKKYPLSYVFASENISACKQAIIQAITGKNKMFLSQTADQIRTDYNIHTWVNRVLNTYEN